MARRNKQPQPYVRVTEVLSVLERFSGVPQHLLEMGRERGSEVHKYCLAYAKGLYLPPPPHIMPWFLCFQEWFDAEVEEVLINNGDLCVEYELTDERFRLKGHVDLIGRLRRERLFRILDLKRVAQIDWIMGLQLGGYEFMAEKEFRRKFGPKAVIHMTPEARIKLVPFPNGDDVASFFYAYHLYNYRNKFNYKA